MNDEVVPERHGPDIDGSVTICSIVLCLILIYWAPMLFFPTIWWQVLNAQKEKPLDPIEPLKKAVVNVINKVIYGHRFEYWDPRYSQKIKAIQEGAKLAASGGFLALFPWLRYLPGDIGPFKNINGIADVLDAGVQTAINEHEWVQLWKNCVETNDFELVWGKVFLTLNTPVNLNMCFAKFRLLKRQCVLSVNAVLHCLSLNTIKPYNFK